MLAPDADQALAGIVITWAGSRSLPGLGSGGFADGLPNEAFFSEPIGISADRAGNVYVSDQDNQRIRKIDPLGRVSTLAGSGQRGDQDGPGAIATFNYPEGLVSDGGGTVYVADRFNNCIRVVSPAGVVSTLAGGSPGWSDGIGAKASFLMPQGLALDGWGHLYVADTGNKLIRRIDLESSSVATVAEHPSLGTPRFKEPYGIAIDGEGNLLVADAGNNRVFRISPEGAANTLAGGTPGYLDGHGAEARFLEPRGISLDRFGTLYVADTLNHCIRRITPSGMVSTLAGGPVPGTQDGIKVAAHFNKPRAIALDASGRAFVADTLNNRIRSIR